MNKTLLLEVARDELKRFSSSLESINITDGIQQGKAYARQAELKRKVERLEMIQSPATITVRVSEINDDLKTTQTVEYLVQVKEEIDMLIANTVRSKKQVIKDVRDQVDKALGDVR